MEGAFRTGGACCEGESQEGEREAPDVQVKPLLTRLLKCLLSRVRKASTTGKDLDRQTLSLQPQLVGLKLGATL